MYSSFARQDRVAIRSTLTAAWAFISLSGLGGLLTPNIALTSDIAQVIALVANFMLAVFGFFAGVGVVSNRYWIEWFAAWFTSGGIFAFAMLSWYFFFIERFPALLQNSSLLTGLLLFSIFRIVSCAAHARKQRQIFELSKSQTGEIPHV
jgi:hypothetical protein